ncbi:MAG: hypothetical protein A3F83_16335 [Candidatus Glassbacteria bacterium RIFCSPLOWO2_12_FULL_58_11]|uniref:Uncharacterized protein n=1 Tax=Candidatus Glassbacteria bacterium RIFCSPLOWO2_12_FULL_58_11 TaxID=1817867 RepID=A0A1F5YS37_9BACT|nr:MAG: hypothetical protein A3F83_16335 [Candidatus Glassbacteria bacterium RIFCSPLOWO2_12_FULL_58_11]
MLAALGLWAAPLLAQGERSAGRDEKQDGGKAAAEPQKETRRQPTESKEKPDKEKKESPAVGAEQPGARQSAAGEGKIFGFVDRDRDGKNDLFQDADGDGINDINGKEYPHNFKFVDKNSDKINDIFVDVDGDGVNDQDVRYIDEDSDGICDNVVDCNKDNVNDITGLRFNRKSLRGYKFGFIKEERNLMMQQFIDENADGIPDARQLGKGPHGMGLRDVFIDRDGDGIDDRREHMQRPGKGMAGGKK